MTTLHVSKITGITNIVKVIPANEVRRESDRTLEAIPASAARQESDFTKFKRLHVQIPNKSE